MKKIFSSLFLTLLLHVAIAQLVPKTKCPDFVVDIVDGKVNRLMPNNTIALIKERLPCFTSSADSSNAKCGRTVFYKDKDIYFYVDREYVQIGPRFQGKLSIPLLGANRNSLFKWFGNPKLKDDKWDAFETSYGILVLHYDKSNKVILIQFSTKNTETLNLCE